MKKLSIFLGLTIVYFSGAAQAETLFTKTDNGAVSINRGLTAKECEMARRKAKGLPATASEIKNAEKAEKESLKKYENCIKGKAQGNPLMRSNKVVQNDCTRYSGSGLVIVQDSDIVQAECLK